MAKSTKPGSTTPRTPRARKSAATPDTTTIETATLETTTPLALSHDVIAMRAYEIFLRDGAPHGRDVEHWLKAESELRARVSRN
ncbi:MAG TPA: DUF2934 domain-containing protein [Vicinamibacterales bacterium]|jgi:hypothetical protein